MQFRERSCFTYESKSVVAGIHSDVYELIKFKLGILDKTELYILIIIKRP